MPNRHERHARIPASLAEADELGETLIRELRRFESALRQLQALGERASELITPELIAGRGEPPDAP